MNKPTIVVQKGFWNYNRDYHPTYLLLRTKHHTRDLGAYTRIRDARRGAKRLQAALGGPRIISIVEE